MNSKENCDYVNDNFVNRQKHLNEQLSKIEKSLNKHNNHKDSHVPKLEELSIKPHKRDKIKGFRGRQSLFKRPEGPAPRSNVRIIPDYRKNPNKWTCYSLDDVSDISNESNSATAFSFLNELKQRRQHELKKEHKINEKLMIESDMFSMDVDSFLSKDYNVNKEQQNNPISFQKPQKKKEITIQDSKPEFRNNKIIMPEYFVGTKKEQKKKKIQNNKHIKVNKNKEMKLDHLQMFDNEEV